MERTKKIDKTMEFTKFRIVYKKRERIIEFDMESNTPIRYKFLEPLYSKLANWFEREGCQLIVVMPLYRLECTSVPIYITSDFGRCTIFDFDEWFGRYNMEVVYKNGRVWRVKG